MAGQYDPQPGDSHVPVPDPTRLTTQLVDRALAAFREVMDTRLDGMDRAARLLALDLDKMAALLRQEMDRRMAAEREHYGLRVQNVADVSGERFAAIATQFGERDTRTAQAADESRISLDAALAAAKEAVSEQNKANALAIGKSEDATKERLDALALLMTTSVKSLEDKIADVKSRLDRGEGQDRGATDTRTERRLDTGQVLQVLSFLVAATAVVLAVVTHH